MHLCKKELKYFASKKNSSIFAPAKESFGPFVYRLGRKIFILERGVRLPYGLLNIND